MALCLYSKSLLSSTFLETSMILSHCLWKIPKHSSLELKHIIKKFDRQLLEIFLSFLVFKQMVNFHWPVKLIPEGPQSPNNFTIFIVFHVNRIS